MKKTAQRGIITCILVCLTATSDGQVQATAQLTATIVNPVMLEVNTGTNTGYEVVKGTLQGGNLRLHLATIKLSTGLQDLFSLSVPASLQLVNNSNNELIIARLINSTDLPTYNPAGQKLISLDEEIKFDDDVLGRHTSMPFDITVHFN